MSPVRYGKAEGYPFHGFCHRFGGWLGREHQVPTCIVMPVELDVTARAAGTRTSTAAGLLQVRVVIVSIHEQNFVRLSAVRVRAQAVCVWGGGEAGRRWWNPMFVFQIQTTLSSLL